MSEIEIEKSKITASGKQKLEEELQNRILVIREEIREKIKEAREQGDLSENAEYSAAREEQRNNEARIEQIEQILKTVEVVDDDEISGDVVDIGCKVTIQDSKKKKMVFDIVGPTEANFLEGKISLESPVGKGIKGLKVGQKCVVKTPAGNVTYKVIAIE